MVHFCVDASIGPVAFYADSYLDIGSLPACRGNFVLAIFYASLSSIFVFQIGCLASLELVSLNSNPCVSLHLIFIFMLNSCYLWLRSSSKFYLKFFI
jgi:hypothetical protein